MNAVDLLDPHARHALVHVVRMMVESDPRAGADERVSLRGLQVALGDVLDQPFPEDVALYREGGGALSPRDRMLAFAACAWIMFADGILERRESEFLRWLADQLRIAEPTARFLIAHARWVRTEHELAPHREADLLLVECARRIAALEAQAAA